VNEPGSQVGELRRLEALRRLGIEGTLRIAELDDLLAVAAAAIGAQGATFTVVDEDVARVLAGTSADAAPWLDRRWSLAEAAVASEDGRATLVVEAGTERAALPVLAGLELPATLAASAVIAPGGERVGAIVAHWTGASELPPDTWDLLAAAARQLGQMLELRAEAGEYRRFVELSPDPVLVLDVDGGIELANPAVSELLGYAEPASMRGLPFLLMVSRRDRASVTSALARVLFARRRTLQVDAELVRTDGRSVPVSMSAGHLRGTRRHLQLVVHDLSERLRVEDERTQLSEQLARAQRLDAVGQVASGLAHDLNNLLVIMVSNLALAEESLRTALGDEDADALVPVREDLAEVNVAVDRAVALTGKLLQFANSDDVATGVCDVQHVVDAVVGLVERTLPVGVHLAVDVAPDLPSVAADAVQLERVLLNLVFNARDALEDGGTITIRSREGAEDAVPGRRVEDTAWAAPRCVELSVADDGIGMDDRTLARAFEPLFTTKTDRGGSGLGLPTVLAFADEVDGSVSVDSTPGRGTTVTVAIPAVTPELPDVPVGLDVPVAGARVLLVDPGERTRRVIARMLRGAGYRVTAVATAEEALTVLADQPTDLLVTELSLPGMTGARLLDTVRELGAVRGVVALASVDAPRTLEGTPVLVKPFSHTRLLRTVERVLADR
jgi:two-component system cell cycle sensor histidine kinase/response regulator CckA